MKKIIAVLLSIALMLSCLPLAFGEDSLTGKIWTMTPESLENLLRASNVEEVAVLAPYASVTLDFRADGTLYTTLTVFSESEKYNDTWSIYSSGRMKMTLMGDDPIFVDYYFDNGCLCLDDGKIVLKFTADGKTYEPAAEAGNPSLPVQGVEGKWKISTETLEKAFSTDAEMDGLANLMTFTMEFIDDGTMIMTVSIMDVDSVSNEVWHYTGDNSLYMTTNSVGYNMTFRFENKNLILNDGLNDVVLEPFDDNDVPAPASPAFTDDLSGQWDGRGFFNYMLVVAATAGQDYTSIQSLFDLMNFTLNLNADGTATLDVEAFGTSDTENLNTWSVSGNIFTISGISFTFTLSGDTLTLTPDVMGEPFTMTRIY